MSETPEIETEDVGRVASNAGLGCPESIVYAPKSNRILLCDDEGWIFGKWNPFRHQWETDHGDQIDATNWLPEPDKPKA